MTDSSSLGVCFQSNAFCEFDRAMYTMWNGQESSEVEISAGSLIVSEPFDGSGVMVLTGAEDEDVEPLIVVLEGVEKFVEDCKFSFRQ